MNNFIKAGVDNYLSLQTDEEKRITKYVQYLIKEKALKGPARIDRDGKVIACLDKNGDFVPLDVKVLKIYDYFEMLYYYSRCNSKTMKIKKKGMSENERRRNHAERLLL